MVVSLAFTPFPSFLYLVKHAHNVIILLSTLFTYKTDTNNISAIHTKIFQKITLQDKKEEKKIHDPKSLQAEDKIQSKGTTHNCCSLSETVRLSTQSKCSHPTVISRQPLALV